MTGKIREESRELRAGGRTFRIDLFKEDLGSTYPGMIRYTVMLCEGDSVLATFRTNTYEYSPTVPYRAEDVARSELARWEEDIARDWEGFFDGMKRPVVSHSPSSAPDVVIIQGSPRPGGNCSLLASWAQDESQRLGREVSVIFPHDLDIHPCIGCYQCYNTGECIFEDDMAGVLSAVAGCHLVVVCTPVYTNTVPAGTKALIDRFQALHALRTIDTHPPEKTRGILMAVAGRRGRENFRCVSLVVSAFFSLIGINPREPVLVDGMDEHRDVRAIPGLEEKVREAVRAAVEEGG
ncbi:MAG: flavodoxin family protein [Methanolinea sp.]|nr:flavodoxin family protein [Methanolinea sp.]